MHVLMVSYEFPPFGGGTGIACARLIDVLARRSDIVVDLVTSGPMPDLERYEMGARVIVHRLPIPKRDLNYWRAGELMRWTFGAIRYTRRLTATTRFDVCHCWAGWPSGVIGCQLRGDVPYIVSLRGSDVPGYSARLRHLDALLMRHVARVVWQHAARVVAVSRDLRGLALSSAPDATIDVIPNGVDVERFTRADVGRRDLLFVGRLIERKGVHLLIEAFAYLAARYPEISLTVVGDGPARGSLEALAEALGVHGRVRFTGRLDSARLIAAYAEAGVFVLPASSDAMPNVVLEAMAAGLAIVTTKTGATEVLHGNGLVVDRPEVDLLQDTIATYLANPAMLASHQRRSRQLAEGMSWSAVADYFTLMYHDIAVRRKALPMPPRDFSFDTR